MAAQAKVSTNPYEVDGSWRKALKLAMRLGVKGVMAREIQGMTQTDWRRLCDAVGVTNLPSDETIMRVAEILLAAELAGEQHRRETEGK